MTRLRAGGQVIETLMASRLRWQRIVVAAACLAILLLLIGLAPIGVRAITATYQRWATMPRPDPATDAEQREILRALSRGDTFLRTRGASPPTHGPDRPRVTLSDESVVICEGSKPFVPDMPHCPHVSGIVAADWDNRIPRKLRQELVLANQTSRPIPDPDVAGVVLRPAAQVHKSISAARFGDLGGGSYVRVSRAVLSDDGQRALIYVDYRCGSLCGAGFIHDLVRDGDRWRLQHSLGLWIS
ncbi:hypothetical protein [Lysobacter sp. F60174L2]|uniref:hypothetical protein n=1 Tax=Lysobacter sp. F60174L2 TaxID=3459295 RepID=UPI00403E16A8